MAQRSLWKAGLIGFLASTILFMTLPLPDGLSIRAQVTTVTLVQLAGILSFCLGWLLWKRTALHSGRSGRAGPQGATELFARLPSKRGHLRLVHSRPANDGAKGSDKPSPG